LRDKIRQAQNEKFGGPCGKKTHWGPKNVAKKGSPRPPKYKAPPTGLKLKRKYGPWERI